MDQGNKANQCQHRAFIAVLGPTIERQLLEDLADRENQTSSNGKLIEERLWHVIGRSGHDDSVERGFLRPALIAVTDARVDGAVAEFRQRVRMPLSPGARRFRW